MKATVGAVSNNQQQKCEMLPAFFIISIISCFSQPATAEHSQPSLLPSAQYRSFHRSAWCVPPVTAVIGVLGFLV